MGHLVCGLPRRASCVGGVFQGQSIAHRWLELQRSEAQDEPAGRKFSPEEKLKLARERSQMWLSRHGNPYVLSVLDLDGRVGIDYGVYGVPETYVIDKEGVIRYKRVGVVTPDLLQSTILPLVQKLNAS